MSSATTINVQTPIAQKINYISQFISQELEILNKIEQVAHTLMQGDHAKNISTAVEHLLETHRRLVDEFCLAQQNVSSEPVDDLWGDLIHFTAVPSQKLFDLVYLFEQETILGYSEKQKICQLLEAYYHIYSLNQAIHLVEQDTIHQSVTAVSILHCLQKPKPLNKAVCIQISGSGARQSFIGHEKLIQTGFDLIFWALSGTVPQNQVWVESDMSETAIYLQIWNDALTLTPVR